LQLLRRDCNIRAAEELLRPIPGPLFEELQSIPAAAAARAGATEKPKVTVVFFIGGITFTEISALRWLAKAESRDIVICTTKLISGQTFLESLIDKSTL
jgi:6,7-dimethyl-8-ribityllumazine synthase